jgi:hypothetical protein
LVGLALLVKAIMVGQMVVLLEAHTLPVVVVAQAQLVAMQHLIQLQEMVAQAYRHQLPAVQLIMQAVAVVALTLAAALKELAGQAAVVMAAALMQVLLTRAVVAVDIMPTMAALVVLA